MGRTKKVILYIFILSAFSCNCDKQKKMKEPIKYILVDNFELTGLNGDFTNTNYRINSKDKFNLFATLDISYSYKIDKEMHIPGVDLKEKFNSKNFLINTMVISAEGKLLKVNSKDIITLHNMMFRIEEGYAGNGLMERFDTILKPMEFDSTMAVQFHLKSKPEIVVHRARVRVYSTKKTIGLR
jgi:hypothetical protein